MTLAALEALNPQITNPNLIFPGQVIHVTGTPAASPAPSKTPTPAPAQTTQASVIYRIQTTKPVVFLTIDDGIYKEPQAAQLMKDNGLVASFFLTYSLIKDNPQYFANLAQATGSRIEAHTYSHQNLVTLSYADQKAEIQKGLDAIQNLYGKRPTLVRPPYGNFNTDTRKAAAALGIKTLVHWDVTVDQGKLSYATSTHLQPGDIVLMHFRPAFAQDIAAFAAAMRAQSLHTELLENWVTP
jgi:peptidoglycan/xylan/chitin deacetylase (PgdA/CDA1 family)